MAYRITYSGSKRYPNTHKNTHYGWIFPFLLVGLLIGVCLLSPGVANTLEQILFPGGKEVFLQLEITARRIQEGEALGAAIDAFCRQVISGVPG